MLRIARLMGLNKRRENLTISELENSLKLRNLEEMKWSIMNDEKILNKTEK